MIVRWKGDLYVTPIKNCIGICHSSVRARL
jgi:hypothetical protein